MSENEQLVNAGTQVETRAYGDVTIREFNFRQLNGLARALVKIFRQLATDQNKDIGQVLLENLDSIDVAGPLEDVLAVAIGKAKPLDLTLAEGMACMNAIIELNDWSQIHTLFFRLMEKMGVQASPKS